MIYRSQSKYSRMPGGYLRFRANDGSTVHGYGQGDYIRMRDEYGNVWVGSATREQDNVVRYRFRDHRGNFITGVSDDYGVMLRDEKGNSWRGFVD
jgi:hypothetical protein